MALFPPDSPQGKIKFPVFINAVPVIAGGTPIAQGAFPGDAAAAIRVLPLRIGLIRGLLYLPPLRPPPEPPGPGE
jgi:hypothetical protein